LASKEIASGYFSKDIVDFIYLLHKNSVKYVIVGGEAVIFYGHIRLTGDIDFFYELSSRNTGNLFLSLKQFWHGSIPEISDPSELMHKGRIIQFGRPPNRIDLLNRIDGVDFNEAWRSREESLLHSGSKIIPVYFIGLRMLIKNKKTVRRPKDLDDLNYLEQI
jgi:hypothetical protein